jgi:hypothetical protein
MKFPELTNDELAKMHTACGTFDELVNCCAADYFPSLTDRSATCQELADRYDFAQAAKGDKRRAWRGFDNPHQTLGSLLEVFSTIEEATEGGGQCYRLGEFVLQVIDGEMYATRLRTADERAREYPEFPWASWEVPQCSRLGIVFPEE